MQPRLPKLPPAGGLTSPPPSQSFGSRGTRPLACALRRAPARGLGRRVYAARSPDDHLGPAEAGPGGRPSRRFRGDSPPPRAPATPSYRPALAGFGVRVTTGRKITVSPNWLRSAPCRDTQVGEVAVNGSAADAEQLADFGHGLILLQVERWPWLKGWSKS